MSLSGINFSGLGSGIDTEGIISQLTQLSQRPIQSFQRRQVAIRERQTAINQISAIVSGLQAAAAALDNTNAFKIVKASSADQTVARATASPGAQAASYLLKVNALAQSHRLASSTQSSQTNALGAAGEIVINGKAVAVSSSDTLQTLAASINAAKSGVSASVISTASGSYTLVLASEKTGASNTVSLSDSASGVILRNLGLIGAGVSIKNATTNGALSDKFADSGSTIKTLLGQATASSGTIQIDGANVAIDFSTDSLTTIAGKINAATIAGVSASVVTETDAATGVSKARLRITGAATPAFTDSNNVLTSLGVLRNAYGNEITAARDASFDLNGLAISRSSNVVSDVVSGVTFTLLKDASAPSTTINVETDIETIQGNIETYVNQYNQLVRKIGELSQFDPQTLATGPLFGDGNIQNLQNSIANLVNGQIPGITGNTAVLSQIGITLAQTGFLNVNSSALTDALTNRTADVARLLQATGIATDTSIAYVASTDKSKSSESAPFAIEITQLATKAAHTAGTSHTANDNASSEVLTFTGGQFGSDGQSVILSTNVTLDDIVSQINGDAEVSRIVAASRSGDRLVLTSKLHGSKGNFTIVSSQAAAANNSGIGDTAISVSGLDVAGTIGGEAATGDGQFLTGNSGNAKTDGLQIRVTSVTTGSKGTIAFTKGIANLSRVLSQAATNTVDGTLTRYSRLLDEEVTDLDKQIATVQERVKSEQQRLRIQFAAMESAVSRIRAASSGLAGLASSLQR